LKRKPAKLVEMKNRHDHRRRGDANAGVPVHGEGGPGSLVMQPAFFSDMSGDKHAMILAWFERAAE